MLAVPPQLIGRVAIQTNDCNTCTEALPFVTQTLRSPCKFSGLCATSKRCSAGLQYHTLTCTSAMSALASASAQWLLKGMSAAARPLAACTSDFSAATSALMAALRQQRLDRCLHTSSLAQTADVQLDDTAVQVCSRWDRGHHCLHADGRVQTTHPAADALSCLVVPWWHQSGPSASTAQHAHSIDKLLTPHRHHIVPARLGRYDVAARVSVLPTGLHKFVMMQ